MKQNKLKYIIIILFAVLIIFCFIKYLRKGHIITYKIENDNLFEIKEIRTRNEKHEKDNYYIEITVNNLTFNYQLYSDFNEKHEIVQDVYYYSGEYTCIYPVFYGEYSSDMKCYKDGIYYPYSNIVSVSADVDNFAKSIKKYNINEFIDNSTRTKNNKNIKIYTDNIVNNHIIGISNLKGLYLINKDVNNHNIFNKDIYSRKISTFVNNYYITADYNESQQFRLFYVVDLNTNKEFTIKAPKNISINSYIEGTIDNIIYLYDPLNESQYKINIKNKKITEIENKKDTVSYYSNNEWTTISKIKANKGSYFNMYIKNNDFVNYQYVLKEGNKLSGYYYLYKNINNEYKVYRASVQNTGIIEYLFTTTDISSLKFIDDYVYFKEKDSIYYYHETSGIRKVLEYDELEFNENLIFGISKID